jgi:TonB family protein
MKQRTMTVLTLIAAASCASTSGVTSPVQGSGYGTATCRERSAIERKRSKFAWFFNEVRCRTREALQCPTASKQIGSAPTSGPRWYSLLNVIVQSTGAVRSVEVAATSGREDVDRAAMDAVRRAGPFSAPPQQLVQSDEGVPFRLGVECAAQPASQASYGRSRPSTRRVSDVVASRDGTESATRRR